MKIRSGFVSNSSSSSFIIDWTYRGKGGGLHKALSVLFELESYFDEETGILKLPSKEEMDGDREMKYSYDAREIDAAAGILEDTEVIEGNEFRTTFFTTMRNSVLDYGSIMHYLITALTIEKVENGNSRFRIDFMKTEDDSF